MIDGIDHVAVVVRDIDVSAEDFRQRLGLQLVHDEIVDGLNVRLAYLQAGDGLLQLVQPVGEGPIADFLAAHGERLHHVCFAVTDIESALDAMIDGHRRPTVVKGGRAMQTCFLPYQPSGLVVELAQS